MQPTETAASVDFTPSETVLIHADYFDALHPDFQSKKFFTLLDGKTKIDKTSLAIRYVIAGILANVEAGVINLATRTYTNSDAHYLVCIPTGQTHNWPKYTLESRLIFDWEISIQSLAESWLIQESHNGYKRAFDLGKIMLVMRGYAVITENDWGLEKTLLSGKSIRQSSLSVAAKTKEMLQGFSAQSPEVFQLMQENLLSAFYNLTHINQRNERFEEPDPWKAELPADVEKFHVYGNSEYETHSKFLNAGPVKWLIKSAAPIALTIVAILLGIGATGFFFYFQTKIAIAFFIVLPIIAITGKRLQQKVVRSVTQKVVSTSEALTATETTGATDKFNGFEIEKPRKEGNHQIVKTETITLDAFPKISEESTQRINEAYLRKPAVKQMYLKYLFLLCLGTILLHACFFYFVDDRTNKNAQDTDGGWLFAETVLMVFTILPALTRANVGKEILRDIYALITSKSGVVRISRNTGIQFSITANRLALAGLLWAFFCL